MSATRSVRARAGRVFTAAVMPAVCLLLLASRAAASDVLFPAPLHITREVSGPFSERKHVIDEYCHGNRVVSISGNRTAIADHAKREITLIDFAAGTYSVTKFEDVARAQDKAKIATTARKEPPEWRVESRGGRVIASRPGEMHEVERKRDAGRHLIRLTADRQITLSRAAAEALLGTSYPNPTSDAGEIVVSTLRSADKYSLPLQYDIVLEVEGQTVETHNVVTRVGHELPPPDLIAIPPGAKLVESDAVAARRLLDELDRPATRPQH